LRLICAISSPGLPTLTGGGRLPPVSQQTSIYKSFTVTCICTCQCVWQVRSARCRTF
jgi:hypothetical protein